jgi:UDP-N-acetylglucosamine 2-epimerase (non-hydrolysing)
MIPLILALDACPHIENTVCVTAQHREMLDQMLNAFNIKPHYDLNLMKAGQTLSDIACRVLKGLEGILREAGPDILFVHGDTLTTFASSLAAFFAFNHNEKRLLLGHVEAGLRSYDKFRPYPEEINRKLTTVLSDYHFAPTQTAREHLLKENIPGESIFVTGNTAVDLLKYTVKADYRFNDETLNKLDFGRRVVTMTAHRSENLGRPLESICRAVNRLTHDFEDITVVWPMHMNPAVTGVARAELAKNPRVVLTSPADVFDMHNLMSRSYMVLTDSGGIQEEAPGLNKPTVVLRDVTERPEGVQAGTLVIAGVEEESIYKTAADILTDGELHKRMASAQNPYGDGNAAQRIVQALLGIFK